MGFLQARCPLAHPANSVEALDGTQSTDNHSQGKLHTGLKAFLIHQVISDSGGEEWHAAFMPFYGRPVE